MAVKNIITLEDRELRRVAKPVEEAFLQSAEYRELAKDMRDTLADSGGIGLAAPQIAISQRIVLFDVRRSDMRLPEGSESLLDTMCINPELSVTDHALGGFWEGCLSVPGYIGYVERPQGVVLSYIDETGTQQRKSLHGFLATVCQHEMDHLDGILYLDRIFEASRLIPQEALENDATDVD